MKEKIEQYLVPMYDAIDRISGGNEDLKARIAISTKVQTLAYMCGRNFRNSVCVMDEAQNATLKQMKLFLSRINIARKPFCAVT